MDQPGLDGRRDKNGDILRKHGAAVQDHEAGRLNRKIAVQSVTLRLPLKPRFLTQPSGPRLEP